MRLNLGCGNNKRQGWVNVDKVAACRPDQIVDLEKLPWPWPSDSAEEIALDNTLEHLGAATEVYLGIMKELYRVCRDGAKVAITVPHPRHDHFLDDPTHVRVVTLGGLELFSQARNREWIAKGSSNTPLGMYLGVDFAVQSMSLLPDPRWGGKVQRGEITMDQLREAALTHNNVISAVTIVVMAIKPPGRP